MSELRRYSDYKDSGVPWLGEIPSHWEVSKLKYLGKIILGLTYSPDNITDADKGTLVLRSSNVQKSELSFKDNVYVDSEVPLNKITTDQDILICSRNGSRSLIGKNALITGDAINQTFGAFMTVYRTPIRSFIYFFLNSEIFKFQIGSFLTSTINQLTTSNLGRFEVSLPPPEEQQAIVNFLDIELKHIDTLISNQQQLIEKLAEQRSAVITHAVTKGLYPNVAMKDSGVEWLGEIPENWHLTYNKYLFNFSRGLTITKADLIDEGIPCVSYGEVHSKYGFEVDPNIHPLKCVPESYAENFKYAVLKEGDFVFADTSEDYKGSGNFTHLNSKTLTMAGYHTVVMKQKHDHNYRYLAYMFDSKAFRTQVINQVSGVKVFSVTQGILKRTSAWLPPLEEQNEIAIYLDKETNRIDQASKANSDIITKLQEYRSALITQAVTGKIDVRDIAKGNRTEEIA